MKTIESCIRSMVVLVGIALLTLSTVAMSANGPGTSRLSSPAEQASIAKTELPVAFIENRGQWNDSVHFMAQLPDMAVWLQRTGMTIQIESHSSGGPITGASVRLDFISAAANVVPVGKKQLLARYSYFLGQDRARWHENVPAFAAVSYKGLYPATDMQVISNQSELVLHWYLEANAKRADLEIQVFGAESLELVADGSLQIVCQAGQLILSRLDAGQYRVLGKDRFAIQYSEDCQQMTTVVNSHPGQSISGAEGDIGSAWIHTGSRVANAVLPHVAAGAGHAPTLEGGAQRSLTPVMSTYYGGTGFDTAYLHGLDTDAVMGWVAIAGQTLSGNFPVTPGAYDESYNGSSDAYVSLWDPQANGSSQLVWATFYGGASADRTRSVHLDDEGIITICGNTRSTDLPTTNNAYDDIQNGQYDVFVARFNPFSATEQLLYATYLGGSSNDGTSSDNSFDPWTDVDVSDSGLIAVAGVTISDDFPVTAGAFDETYNGAQPGQIGGDHFVFALDVTQDPSLQLVYCTYIGGTSEEDFFGAIKWADNETVIMAGWTTSTDYPVTDNAMVGSLADGMDGVLVKLALNGQGQDDLLYSSYLHPVTAANCLHVGAEGLITLAGWADSGFVPTDDGYDQEYGGGPWDAFVAQLDLTQSPSEQLVYGTFLGGSGEEGANGLAVNEYGHIFVTGPTTSADFPITANAWDLDLIGWEAYLAVLAPHGAVPANQLVHATYVGGSQTEWGYDVGLLGCDSPVIVGYTNSADFLTSDGCYDPSYNLGVDLYIVMFEELITPVAPDRELLALDLGSNYPNPFNPSTVFEFTLPAESQVDLAIFDLRGKRVKTLKQAALSRGPHKARWDGMDEQGKAAPSGVYIVRLESADEVVKHKMTLAR